MDVFVKLRFYILYKLRNTLKYKIGCWLLTLRGADWRSNLNVYFNLAFLSNITSGRHAKKDFYVRNFTMLKEFEESLNTVLK